jgi:hypothetical protein
MRGELNLGGLTHNRVKEWVKLSREYMSQGELSATKEGRYHLKPASRIQPILTGMF